MKYIPASEVEKLPRELACRITMADGTEYNKYVVDVDHLDALLATAVELTEPGYGNRITHNVGENDELFKRYGIRGTEHTKETEQLCEVIRKLESYRPAPDDKLKEALDKLVKAVDAMRFHQVDGDKAEVTSDFNTYVDAIKALAVARAALRKEGEK